MNAVKHKSWGNGTIVKREIYINGVYTEVKEGGNYITARFDDGKEIRFGIPRSFETGMLEALGDLKEEVDNAAVEMQRKHKKEKNIQKRTVINALKRLHEFAKINTPTNVVTW